MNHTERSAATQAQQVLVRRAAWALANAGLVNAYGHCSARIDRTSFLVCASRPMGMIAPNENGTVVPIDGPLPEGVLGEVRVHQQIYKRRPDVNGIARTFPPNVLALSALKLVPVARHGFGAYFAPQPPFWDDPLLLRSDGLAANFAEALGSARAIVIRGNGAVTVGDTLETAVVLAWYLEDAARVELAVLASGVANPPIFTAEQAEARAITAGQIFERMWSYLTRDDGAEDNGFNRGV